MSEIMLLALAIMWVVLLYAVGAAYAVVWLHDHVWEPPLVVTVLGIGTFVWATIWLILVVAGIPIAEATHA